MKSPLLKWVLSAAALGALIAIVFSILFAFLIRDSGLSYKWYRLFNRVQILLWPSSFWMEATAGEVDTATHCEFLSLAILGNVVVYSAIGLVLFAIKRLIASALRR
jgi:hypothetical protein